MTREVFLKSLAHDAEPPRSLTPALRALWLDAKGDWDGAHEVAQSIAGAAGARIHAYLHRKEGDASNARYWYARAGIAPSKTSLEREWQQLVDTEIGA